MLVSTIYSIFAVLLVSLVSVIAVIPLFIYKKIPKKLLVILLSISVGVLLSTVFINFLPEIYLHDYSITTSFVVLFGFLFVFVLEKLVHWHHSNKCEEGGHGHSHAYHLAPINLLGDGIHNFLDGLVIAGSFAVNINLGVASTIAIIFHEVPQEIADFGVLLYSGLTKKKALLFNFMSALTAVLGAIVGIVLSDLHGFTELIIPFAAGNFIYIAASNLVPQLHRHCKLKDTIMHIIAIILGIALIVVVTIYGTWACALILQNHYGTLPAEERQVLIQYLRKLKHSVDYTNPSK